MKTKLGYLIISSTVVLAACSSTKDKPGGSSGSGNIGEAGDSSSITGDSGSGNIGEAGDSSSITAGSSATGGSSSPNGGSSTTGGSSSTTGGSSSTSGGASGSGGQSGVEDRGYLLGPVKDNQVPLVIPAADRLPAYCVSGGLNSDIEALWADANGNVFIALECGFSKLDAQHTVKWTLSQSGANPANVLAVAVEPAGNVFVGENNRTAVEGQTNVVVAKYDTDGNQLWRSDGWTSGSGGAHPSSIVLASNGAVYVTGAASGQVPGNPPEAANGAWIERYEAGGTRSWLKQYAGYFAGTALAADMVIDSSDNLFSAANGKFSEFDSSGKQLLSFASMIPGISGGFAFDGFGSLVLAADGKSIFTWTNNGGLDPAFLMNVALDGRVNWYRSGEPQRMAVIDSVEGTTWRGQFGGPLYSAVITSHMLPGLVSADAIYLAGYYQNTYMHGSSTPPTTNPAFVARYDLDGNRVWFQEYLSGDTYALGGAGGGLVFDPDGNLTVAFNGGPRLAGAYLFRVNAKDGSIIQ